MRGVLPLLVVAWALLVRAQDPQLCDMVARVVLPGTPTALTVRVPRTVPSSSAVVLTLRPIPFGGPTAYAQATLRVQYLLRGQPLTASSDAYGIAELSGPIDAGTLLNVSLRNDGDDGPVAVELMPYATPEASCGLLIDHRDPFAAPLSPSLTSVSGPPPLFLMAVAPPDGNGFEVDAGPDVDVFYGRDIDAKSLATPLHLGRVVDWNARLLYLKVVPTGSATSVRRITIAWRGGDPVPSGVPLPSPATTSRGRSVLGTVLWVLLLLLIAYLVGRSAYNYRVGGEREFPKFIPHHEQFRGGFETARRFAEHMTQRGTARATPAAQGYNDVNTPT